jgi:Aldo/keto reductase family
MREISRRRFLERTSAAAGALIVAGTTVPARPPRKSPTDWVNLGNSGIKVTRLAFGTGTFGGKVQRELGQEQFTRLVRHAYDRGIRFFETADAYQSMPVMLATALKGLPRDSYRLMTKYRIRETDNPKATLDRMRKDLNSEYVDILLLHCVRSAGWPGELQRLRDEFSEAKERKIILAHGASCHGLLPLRVFPGNKWLDVALVRVNHNGTRMDTLQGGDGNEKGDVDEVVSRVREIRGQGTGVIAMKLMGEGRFTTPEDRDASIRFVAKLGTVDAITIGYKSPAEVDEAIERLDAHLNS